MHLASATRAFGANRPVIFGKVWAAGSRLSCRPGGQGRDLHLNRRPVTLGGLCPPRVLVALETLTKRVVAQGNSRHACPVLLSVPYDLLNGASVYPLQRDVCRVYHLNEIPCFGCAVSLILNNSSRDKPCI